MAVLVNGLHRKFPALRGIRIDYSWWGWVDVSHDMMPRIRSRIRARPCSTRSATAATACRSRRMPGGAWRSASPAAATRPSRCPSTAPRLEYPNVFNTVRSRAFAPFRRFGQQFLYRWYYLRDGSSDTSRIDHQTPFALSLSKGCRGLGFDRLGPNGIDALNAKRYDRRGRALRAARPSRRSRLQRGQPRQRLVDRHARARRVDRDRGASGPAHPSPAPPPHSARR